MSSVVSRIHKQRETEIGTKIDKKDSLVDFYIKVTKADLVLAKKRDPNKCVLARAARRCFENVVEAWVFETAVWLHLVNEDGSEVFLRGIPGPDLKRNIKTFDDVKNGKFESGTFAVLSPKGGQTMDAIHKRSAKRKGRHQPAGGKIRRRPRINTRVNWSGV